MPNEGPDLSVLLDSIREGVRDYHTHATLGADDTAYAALRVVAAGIHTLDLWLSRGAKLPAPWAYPSGIPRQYLATMDSVLMDMQHANDCCARHVARQQASAMLPDAEVKCPSCGSHYRYMEDRTRKAFVWRWSVPTSPRKLESVHSLRTIIDAADEHDRQRNMDSLEDDPEGT